MKEVRRRVKKDLKSNSNSTHPVGLALEGERLSLVNRSRRGLGSEASRGELVARNAVEEKGLGEERAHDVGLEESVISLSEDEPEPLHAALVEGVSVQVHHPPEPCL